MTAKEFYQWGWDQSLKENQAIGQGGSDAASALRFVSEKAAQLLKDKEELLDALIKINECLNDGIPIQRKDPFHNNVIKRLIQKHRP